MALHIRISTDYDADKTPAEQIEEAMAALGFVRQRSSADIIKAMVATREPFASVVEQNEGNLSESGPGSHAVANGASSVELGPDTRGVMNVGLDYAEADAEEAKAEGANGLAQASRGPDPEYAHPSGRKFGEAGDGRKRRTKAEMAEDTAYLASLDNKVNANEPLPENVYMDANGDVKFKQEEIPSNPEEDAQDAADEAAEAAADKPAGGALTLEDLRRAIGDYAKKHGMAKASANVPAILGGPMLEARDFEHAIGRVKLATATSDGLLHEADVSPQATKDDLMEAVMVYASKYEGKGVKPASGGPTAVDLAEVMRQTFPGTSGALSEIPATPEGYGKALAAVNAAITGNPFKRVAK
jgi:hypothetical protein